MPEIMKRTIVLLGKLIKNRKYSSPKKIRATPYGITQAKYKNPDVFSASLIGIVSFSWRDAVSSIDKNRKTTANPDQGQYEEPDFLRMTAITTSSAAQKMRPKDEKRVGIFFSSLKLNKRVNP